MAANITATVTAPASEILTGPAIDFLEALARNFEDRRRELLGARVRRQQTFDQGALPDFLPETASIREAEWTVAPIPKDLLDRRVEITGPVDRKMVINALNSGANVFMADFEDSNAPTWSNVVEGQINLRDAVNRSIRLVSPEGKKYELAEKTATLLVRPRGWHLVEKHVLVDSQPISASLFDFGLFFFHNVSQLLQARNRSVFLSAQNGEPSGSPALERRFRFRPGTAVRPERNNSSDGSD